MGELAHGANSVQLLHVVVYPGPSIQIRENSDEMVGEVQCVGDHKNGEEGKGPLAQGPLGATLEDSSCRNNSNREEKKLDMIMVEEGGKWKATGVPPVSRMGLMPLPL